MQIDARGLKCPLPVLKLEKALAQGAPGQTLRLLATDAMARVDVPFFCERHGHAWRLEAAPDGALAFTITHSGANAPPL